VSRISVGELIVLMRGAKVADVNDGIFSANHRDFEWRERRTSLISAHILRDFWSRMDEVD
jgi:hypothetical protein